MPFHLLRLPYLASREVMRSMTCSELFTMANLSERTKKFIAACMPKNRLRVRLEMDQKSIKVTVGDLHFASQEGAEFSEFKNFIAYLGEVFNKPSAELDIRRLKSAQNALTIIRILKNLQYPIKSVNFDIPETSPELYIQLMEECRGVEYLNIKTRLPEGFSYSPEVYEVDHFIVFTSSDWVNLEDFMECRDVDLFNLSSTTLLNGFFKKWMETGGDCRLRTVFLSFERGTNVNFKEIIEGLGAKRLDNLQKSVEIQGRHGKKAIIKADGDFMLFEVQ